MKWIATYGCVCSDTYALEAKDVCVSRKGKAHGLGSQNKASFGSVTPRRSPLFNASEPRLKSTGEPDAGNLHVRIEEGGGDPPLLYFDEDDSILRSDI